MPNYAIHIPFAPSNYDYLDTVINQHFYVKKIIDGGFEIILYRNSAEPNRTDKTEYLEFVTTISGVTRDETSVITLSLNIEYDGLIDFNYIYIPTFNRYYFVTDVTLVNYNLYEVSLSVDVLMTYKDAIYECKAFIDRNEFDYNKLIVDDNVPLQQGHVITQEFISNAVFDTNGGTYVAQGLNISVINDS